MEGPQEFACKALEGAPNLKTPELLILDGQQRMTALYQALTDTADEVYYIIQEVIRSGTLEDEHVRFEPRARFMKRCGTLEKQAKAGSLQ